MHLKRWSQCLTPTEQKLNRKLCMAVFLIGKHLKNTANSQFSLCSLSHGTEAFFPTVWWCETG